MRLETTAKASEQLAFLVSIGYLEGRNGKLASYIANQKVPVNYQYQVDTTRSVLLGKGQIGHPVERKRVGGQYTGCWVRSLDISDLSPSQFQYKTPYYILPLS